MIMLSVSYHQTHMIVLSWSLSSDIYDCVVMITIIIYDCVVMITSLVVIIVVVIVFIIISIVCAGGCAHHSTPQLPRCASGGGCGAVLLPCRIRTVTVCLMAHCTVCHSKTTSGGPLIFFNFFFLRFNNDFSE